MSFYVFFLTIATDTEILSYTKFPITLHDIKMSLSIASCIGRLLYDTPNFSDAFPAYYVLFFTLVCIFAIILI